VTERNPITIPDMSANVIKTVLDADGHRIVAVLEDDTIDKIAKRVVQLLKESHD
jgi:hypothetical protein